MMLLDLGNLSMSCISRGWCSVSFGILNGLSDSLLQSFRPISPHQVSTVHVEISGFCEHTGDVSYNLHITNSIVSTAFRFHQREDSYLGALIMWSLHVLRVNSGSNHRQIRGERNMGRAILSLSSFQCRPTIHKPCIYPSVKFCLSDHFAADRIERFSRLFVMHRREYRSSLFSNAHGIITRNLHTSDSETRVKTWEQIAQYSYLWPE